MTVLNPNLSTNLSQILNRPVQVNDLQYDYYTKFAAVACRSHGSYEVIILVKDIAVPNSCTLNYVTSIPMKAEPLFLSWAPPNFGKILVVVSSDNSLSYFKCQSTNKGEVWSSFYENNNVTKSISCLSLGTSESGELLVALGSLNGHITVVFSQLNYEHCDFQAHVGGVHHLAFNGTMLASAGVDGFLSVWLLKGKKFELLQKLPVDNDGNFVTQFHSLCWNKDGDLAIANDNELLLFLKGDEWKPVQTIKIKHLHNFAFNNDRIIINQDKNIVIYKKNNNGVYQLDD